MSLVVTGSIGIDTVETPYGRRENILGGSAIYFSYAASFFTPVRLVGAVGADAPEQLKSVFAGRDVDAAAWKYAPAARRSAGMGRISRT